MRLIDADALLYDLEIVPLTGDGGVDANDLDDIIKRQPTIEERKTGRWLPDNTYLYEPRFICSECHKSERVPTTGFDRYIPIWDYCPNCGCRMMEVEHDS